MRISMPMPGDVLLCALALLLTIGGAAAATATPHVYPGIVDKPADPDFIYSRSVFDCFPPDTLTVSLGTMITRADSTIGRDSLVSSYSCRPWNENGPEVIYRLIVETDLHLTADVRDNVFDLDIFLLDDCDTDNCIVGESLGFAVDLEAGTSYFLVVDSVNQADTFTLLLTATPQGLPFEACAAAQANFISCANDTFILPETQELFGQDNLVSVYDCGTSPKTAGEIWYALEQGPGASVTVQVDNVSENLDVNLWLFEDCGPDATCLQFVDDNIANFGETLTWTNDHPSENVTVFLAVDAVREMVPVEPDTVSFMRYSLEIRCQGSVPVQKTPFGSFKSLYR